VGEFAGWQFAAERRCLTRPERCEIARPADSAVTVSGNNRPTASGKSGAFVAIGSCCSAIRFVTDRPACLV
jgi:hypothetical protein